MNVLINPRRQGFILALAVASLTFGARAGEQADIVNCAGTWKWTLVMANGQTYERNVNLKQAGDRLTGSSIWPDGAEAVIQEGRIKGSELSFTLTRQQADQKIVSKYQGKISGDTIKGSIESPLNGQPRHFDWLAKRAQAEPAQPATGIWKWSFDMPSGPAIEPSVKLKQDGEKLTGLLTWGNSEQPISEGKAKDGVVSFKVLTQRDGRTVTAMYQGKVSGDTIKGKRDSDWSGENVSRDWEAKRVKE
jgi:hypothetical protein